MAKKRQRILIVGGGFAGVKLARSLLNSREFDVGLMSDTESLYYYPALYRSVTGRVLSQSEIPLKQALSGGKSRRIHLIHDKAKLFDADKHTVTCESGAVYSYDKVVFALGAVTSYFGIAGLEEFSYGMKSPQTARLLRQHLHEVLTREGGSERDFIVVGAGPTGVELSAALIKYIKEIAKAHGLKRHALRVHLVEAAPDILPRMSNRSVHLVTKRLKKLGVHIMCKRRVESSSADGLMVNGKEMKSKTVIWTSGVANNPFFAVPENASQLTINKRQRVVVDSHLIAAQDMFVIGDNAATEFAGLAETAVNDAKYVAKYLKREARGQETRAYLQPRPISSIPVGEHWAIVEYGKWAFGGLLGWMVRELADLIGYLDVLPTHEALKRWLSSSEREDDCKLCK